MVRATLRMKVQAGREAEFEDEWRKVAEATRRAPGNLRQALLRSSDEPATYIIASDWIDRAAFGVFERSTEQEDLTAPLRALRESASMRVDDLVSHVDAEG